MVEDFSTQFNPLYLHKSALSKIAGYLIYKYVLTYNKYTNKILAINCERYCVPFEKK